jgi:hypothetical protein
VRADIARGWTRPARADGWRPFAEAGKVAKARHDKGTLIASGFIAGGALVGVLAALLKFVEDSAHVTIVPDLTRVAALGLGPWLAAWGNWIGLAVFLALGAGVYWDSWREGKPVSGGGG